MSYYDIFADLKHPTIFQRCMIYLNENIISYILGLSPRKNNLEILEIGPGKGYFYAASKKFPEINTYAVIDQNTKILKKFRDTITYRSTLPKFPVLKKKFDIIYVAFVLEHLQSGKEIYEFIKNAKRYLKDSGLLVILVPDTLKQKMQFWNIDYTHLFPTTKRNVSMILRDNKMKIEKIASISGLLTIPSFERFFSYRILRIIVFFYHYEFMQVLFSLVYHKPIYDTENIFYRLYCFLKEENFILVARKD